MNEFHHVDSVGYQNSHLWTPNPVVYLACEVGSFDNRRLATTRFFVVGGDQPQAWNGLLLWLGLCTRIVGMILADYVDYADGCLTCRY